MPITFLQLQLRNPHCAVVLVCLHEDHSAVWTQHAQLPALGDGELEHRLVGGLVRVLLQGRSAAEWEGGERRWQRETQ